MFKVEMIGNLGADCEVKDSNGSKFVTFRLAHTEKYKQQDGREVVDTSWIDVTYNKTDSGLLPYLKQGVKVFVRGNAHLRVYSSKKDRCMKAGLTIAAMEIELCGGASEDVPRQLIDPNTGALVDVTKWYWCNVDTKAMKKDEVRELIDKNGAIYEMAKTGFVKPKAVEQPQGEEQTEQTEQQA